jgi:hypothetical protein
MRSPIFYDNNNTGFYVDPASTTQLHYVLANNWFRAQGDSGFYTQDYGGHLRRSVSASYGTWEIFGYNKGGYAGMNIIDPQGYWNNYMHENGNGGLYIQNSGGKWVWYYSRGNKSMGIGSSSTVSGYALRVNDSIYVNSTSYVAGQAYAPIYYDANDSGYYLDPNSTSQSALRIRGGALHGPNPTWGKYLLVGGNGRDGYVDNGDVASVSTTNGNLHVDAASGYGLYLNYYDGSQIYFGGGGNNTWGEFSGGIFYAYNQMRSPIMYDYNNTGYYVDPASDSQLNTGTFQGRMRYSNYLVSNNEGGLMGNYNVT